MWIRTGKHHINMDKIEYTKILKNGSIGLYFSNGDWFTLEDNEALEMTTYLDSVSAPSWSLIAELKEDKE